MILWARFAASPEWFLGRQPCRPLENPWKSNKNNKQHDKRKHLPETFELFGPEIWHGPHGPHGSRLSQKIGLAGSFFREERANMCHQMAPCQKINGKCDRRCLSRMLLLQCEMSCQLFRRSHEWRLWLGWTPWFWVFCGFTLSHGQEVQNPQGFPQR